MRRLVLSTLAACLLSPVPSMAKETATRYVGDVLVGVDTLGRVVAAVDTVPTDGLADHCFIFTAPDRLSGPWSRNLGDAKVVYAEKTLKIVSVPDAFALSVSLEKAEPSILELPPFVQAFEVHNGVELAIMSAGPGGGNALAEMNMEDISTWPEAWWYDYHAPESGPCLDDSDCDAGGKGSTSCGITDGFGRSCSVECGEDSYACCKFGVTVQCRCRTCVSGE